MGDKYGNGSTERPTTPPPTDPPPPRPGTSREPTALEVHEAARDGFAEVAERLDFIQREQEATQAAVLELVNGRDPRAAPQMATTGDRPWLCPCGYYLGTYDPVEDVLRIRVKETLLTFQPGFGGRITMSCRRCARTVEQLDTRAQPPAAG